MRWHTCHFIYTRRFEKLKINERGRQEPNGIEFLAVREAYKAIFWPTLGSEERTLDSSGFFLSFFMYLFSALDSWTESLFRAVNSQRWSNCPEDQFPPHSPPSTEIKSTHSAGQPVQCTSLTLPPPFPSLYGSKVNSHRWSNCPVYQFPPPHSPLCR